jgi:hypothetical protein
VFFPALNAIRDLEQAKMNSKEEERINLLHTFSPHLENVFFSLSDAGKPFKML